MELDMETRKSLHELQEKMVETQSKLNSIAPQVNEKQMEMRRCGLTAQEIDKLPDTARLFAPVGRMFILTNKEAVLDGLEADLKQYQKDVEFLNGTKEVLERNFKENKASLEDLFTGMQARQAAK